ncbi:MFS transporter [Rhodovibrionaceae bacterium A322]
MSASLPDSQPAQKWRNLSLLALCEVCAMALWFSATAIVPSLQQEMTVSGFQASLFTSAVQLGFVAGSLLSAFLGLADRLEPRRFFMISALVAALANASLLLIDINSILVALPRFITGACMAGIYPVGMKMATSWAKNDMGLLVGLLVAALTLGSAAPHLFNALGGLDWRLTLLLASGSALLSAFLIRGFTPGPGQTRSVSFHSSQLTLAWRNKALRLANFGYLGHMWELYAMWAWIGLFLQASFLVTLPEAEALSLAKISTFATVAIGALGALSWGRLADFWGRTRATSLAMIISGGCALTIGLAFGGPIWLVLAIALIWGVTVIADSAQFSAAIAELSPPESIGTLLTLQTALGFLLTLITIHMMPSLVELLGWHFAFVPLAIGPFFGAWAMLTLRRQPDASKLAGGRG